LTNTLDAYYISESVQECIMGAVRFNITLPDDLRQRMAKYDALNWSSVAADAFRRKILEVEAMSKNVAGMAEFKQRMQAQAELDDNEMYELGLRSGREWAITRAKRKELKRLYLTAEIVAAEIYPGFTDPAMLAKGTVEYFEQDRSGGGVLVGMVESINGVRTSSRREAESLWPAIVDVPQTDILIDEAMVCGRFHTGFIEAAITMWLEVA
jgi:hypothetical protein